MAFRATQKSELTPFPFALMTKKCGANPLDSNQFIKDGHFKNNVRPTIDLMVLNHAEGFFGTTLVHAAREAFLNVPACS